MAVKPYKPISVPTCACGHAVKVGRLVIHHKYPAHDVVSRLWAVFCPNCTDVDGVAIGGTKREAVSKFENRLTREWEVHHE